MSNSFRRKLLAAAAPAALLGSFAVGAPPTQADISNPGAVSFQAVNGTFKMNTGSASPLEFKFPNTLGPWACNDGIDNDVDGDIDGADGECAATPVGALQNDDNESLAGYQGQFECNNSIDDNLDYPAIVGHRATASASGTDSVLVTKPTGTATNDVMVAIFGSKTTNPAEVTDPAGWTRLAFSATADGSATLYTRTAVAGEAANYTFAETMAGAQGVSAIIGSYTPTAGAAVTVSHTVDTTGTNQTAWSYPAIDPPFVLTRIVRMGTVQTDAGAQTWTTPNPLAPAPATTGTVRVQSTAGVANSAVSHSSDDVDYVVAADGTTSAAAPSAIRYTVAITNLTTGGGADFNIPPGFVRKDSQCGTVNDNTEFFTTDPPATYVPPTFTGTVAANGDISITSVTQQKKWIHFPTGISAVPIAHARVTFKYTNLPITGHADPLTGEVTLDKADIAIFIVIQGLGNCELPKGAGGTLDPATGTEALPPLIDPGNGAPGFFSVTGLTTGTSGSLTGSPYNQSTGVASLVRGDFAIPYTGDCVSTLAEDAINTMLGLPAAGGNDATFVLKSTPILTSNPSISGTVTNNAGGAPLAGMNVGLYPATGTGRLATDTTDASGNYSFENLTAGNYRVKAWDPAGNFFSEWNLNQPTWSAATNVAAAVGPTTDVDFGLDAGAARIQGRVRDRNAPGVTPLAGATVTLYDSGGNVVGVDSSGLSGWYDFPSLAAGSYKLRFSKAGYFTEWYQDKFLGAQANAVTVTAGQDLQLNGYPNEQFLTRTTNPEITGTVTEQVGGAPIAGATVRLYTAGGQVNSTTTNGSGQYMFGGIALHTDYFVRFEAPAHTNEWFNNAGAAFDDCSGQPQPCTPTTTFADAVNWSGGLVGFTNINGSLS